MLRPNLAEAQKGKALEGLGCSLNTVPPEPLNFAAAQQENDEQENEDINEGGEGSDEHEHTMTLRYLKRIGEDRSFSLMIEAFPHIQRTIAGHDDRNGNNDNGHDATNEDSEGGDDQGDDNNDDNENSADEEENAMNNAEDADDIANNGNGEGDEDNDNANNGNEAGGEEITEDDRGQSHRGGPGSPKHKTHKSGARPKRKKHTAVDDSSEAPDRTLEPVKVTPENPVHLCPVRDKRGCRYEICHGCFMDGNKDRSKCRRRGKPKGNTCQHDDLEGFTCFGERNYFCRRYFEGPSEGGNYPNHCCKCKVSLLGWR